MLRALNISALFQGHLAQIPACAQLEHGDLKTILDFCARFLLQVVYIHVLSFLDQVEGGLNAEKGLHVHYFLVVVVHSPY